MTRERPLGFTLPTIRCSPVREKEHFPRVLMSSDGVNTANRSRQVTGYPLATVATLRAGTIKNTATATRNDYLQSVRQFVRWLVENDRMLKNPLLRLKAANVRTDRRRRRGTLALQEINDLLRTTLASTKTFRRLSGRDRQMLYRVALSTGYRARELASVTPASFDLKAKTLAIEADDTKNRRAAHPAATD